MLLDTNKCTWCLAKPRTGPLMYRDQDGLLFFQMNPFFSDDNFVIIIELLIMGYLRTKSYLRLTRGSIKIFKEICLKKTMSVSKV